MPGDKFNNQLRGGQIKSVRRWIERHRAGTTLRDQSLRRDDTRMHKLVELLGRNRASLLALLAVIPFHTGIWMRWAAQIKLIEAPIPSSS